MASDIGMTHFSRPPSVLQGTGPSRAKEVQTPPDGGRADRAEEAWPDRQQLDAEVSGVNDLVHELQRELHFAVDEYSGETVIKVVDSATDKVVRQIPAEDIVRLRQRLEEAAGALFQDSA